MECARLILFFSSLDQMSHTAKQKKTKKQKHIGQAEKCREKQVHESVSRKIIFSLVGAEYWMLSVTNEQKR